MRLIQAAVLLAVFVLIKATDDTNSMAAGFMAGACAMAVPYVIDAARRMFTHR